VYEIRFAFNIGNILHFDIGPCQKRCDRAVVLVIDFLSFCRTFLLGVFKAFNDESPLVQYQIPCQRPKATSRSFIRILGFHAVQTLYVSNMISEKRARRTRELPAAIGHYQWRDSKYSISS
jgi:hypothetical protein